MCAAPRLCGMLLTEACSMPLSLQDSQEPHCAVSTSMRWYHAPRPLPRALCHQPGPPHLHRLLTGRAGHRRSRVQHSLDGGSLSGGSAAGSRRLRRLSPPLAALGRCRRLVRGYGGREGVVAGGHAADVAAGQRCGAGVPAGRALAEVAAVRPVLVCGSRQVAPCQSRSKPACGLPRGVWHGMLTGTR